MLIRCKGFGERETFVLNWPRRVASQAGPYITAFLPTTSSTLLFGTSTPRRNMSGSSRSSKCPAKRARTDDGANAVATDVPPEPEPPVQGDPGNTQFRVLKSLLMSSSPVFEDMFTLAQPGEQDRGSSDSPPVVILHDNPVDVARLLKALFDPK